MARLEGSGALADRGLAVRRLVLVNDTLAGCLVECAGGLAGQRGGCSSVAGIGGLAELAYGGLDRGLHVLVAQPSLLVGQDALLLRLDVRHGLPRSFVSAEMRSVIL